MSINIPKISLFLPQVVCLFWLCSFLGSAKNTDSALHSPYRLGEASAVRAAATVFPTTSVTSRRRAPESNPSLGLRVWVGREDCRGFLAFVLRVPGVSMTLEKWGHDPYLLGHDSNSKGSWRLQVGVFLRIQKDRSNNFRVCPCRCFQLPLNSSGKHP